MISYHNCIYYITCAEILRSGMIGHCWLLVISSAGLDMTWYRSHCYITLLTPYLLASFCRAMSVFAGIIKTRSRRKFLSLKKIGLDLDIQPVEVSRSQKPGLITGHLTQQIVDIQQIWQVALQQVKQFIQVLLQVIQILMID